MIIHQDKIKPWKQNFEVDFGASEHEKSNQVVEQWCYKLHNNLICNPNWQS